MQTVNFQCGHCNKLMGVGTELLGQQVRCPHCQQVVLAPAPVFAATVTLPPSPPAPPPIEIQPPPPVDENEHESIFGEVIDDDLFGRPVKPVLEVPPHMPPVPPAPAPDLPPGMPHLELQPTVIQMSALPEMQPGSAPAPAPAPELAPFPQFLEGGTDGAAQAMTATFAPQAPPEGAFSAPANEWPATEASGPAAEAQEDLPPVAVPRSPTMRQPASSTAMMYVWLCLVPYAIVMTVIASLLYYKQATTPNPADDLLWKMPDAGERPGAQPTKDKKKGQHTTIIFERTPPDRALPAKALVALGETIPLGDLEVTPESIERKRVVYRVRNYDELPQKETRDSLVLHVTLKNVSKDWCWYPTDPAFERAWNDKKNAATNKPYMFLDLVDKKDPENKRFYGSAFDWPQIKQPGVAQRKEYVDGQEEHEKLLCPGEEMKTVFFTNPADDIPEHLAAYNGKLVWRIHLRRGVVEVKDRLISTTGVVGVKFTKDEIK